MLDEVAYGGTGYDTSPKQAAFKDIVKQLVSYESFEAFRDMMITAAAFKIQEKFENGYNEDEEDAKLTEYIDTLTAMGYKASHIDQVLGRLEPYSNPTVEELINQIERLQADGSPSKAQSNHGSATQSQTNYDTSTSQGYDQGYDQGYYGTATDEADTSEDAWVNYRRYCNKMAASLAEYKTANPDSSVPIPTDDYNEVDAKFVMAQSVMDNFNKGVLIINNRLCNYAVLWVICLYAWYDILIY